LHTNDAISSTMRLIDMKAEGFLVAGALRGVLAQRLVRRICDDCRIPYTPTPQEQTWITGFTGQENHPGTFMQGLGCSRCNNRGYRGRTGIYEFLEITEPLANALRASDANTFTRLAKEQTGFKSLGLCAFELASSGWTTIAEVLRITGELA